MSATPGDTPLKESPPSPTKDSSPDNAAAIPTLTAQSTDESVTTATATPSDSLLKKAKWSDVFTVFAAGAALVSDGYQNNSMTNINVLFGKRYGKAVYTSEVSTRVSNALLVGAVLGQITVGVICDRIGRKSAIILSTLLLLVGAIFATGAAPIGGSVNALFWWLTVARGAVGYGVGAEYPVSSSSATEAANERYGRKKRATVFILCTNLVLSLGGPIATIVYLIVLSATGYDNTTSSQDVRKLDITWRVCFGFGALLPMSVFYFRMKMLNSKLYRQGAIKRNVPYWLFLKRYWPRLLGTAGTWFLYDAVTFPNGVFSGTIISSILKNPTLKHTAEYQLLLGVLSLPGAIIGAFLVARVGTRWQMMIGFGGYLVIGLIIGLAWDKIINIPAVFVILFAIFTSMGNLGPGSICGLVSSESYPTALRASAYGLSAAVGKAGAAIGTQIFQPIQDSAGKKYTFIVAAGIGVIGMLIAWFLLIDTTKLDLEQEDKEWNRYLVQNGWTGVIGAPEEGLDRNSKSDSEMTSSAYGDGDETPK
ncbi:unnamed protein product [Sympodiomycopsis kandeliae]